MGIKKGKKKISNSYIKIKYTSNSIPEQDYTDDQYKGKNFKNGIKGREVIYQGMAKNLSGNHPYFRYLKSL